MENGRKYRSNEKTYVTGVRRISDELCGKHHLSVIHTEKSERVARPYAQWLAEQNGAPHGKTPIQQDIDAAIAASPHMEAVPAGIGETGLCLPVLTASTLADPSGYQAHRPV